MYKEIIEHLLQGNASDLTQQVIMGINAATVRLLEKIDLEPFEVEIMGDILHISNIIYNNTDRSILVLEDGVYDLLLQKYKRYNPNYQVGAEPVHFDSIGETIVEEKPKDTSMDVFEVIDAAKMKKMLFHDDIYGSNTYRRADFGNETTINKRLRNTSHNYPNLVGTLDKAKFTLIQEAMDKGAYDDPNVVIFERDFLWKHIREGIVDQNNISLVCELKYDGVSVEADVTDEVVSARSRGDTGIDQATDLTPIFQGYPFIDAKKYAEKNGLKLEQFGMKFEAIIDNFALQELAQLHGIKYVSSRNAIIGLTSRKDARKYAHYITLVPLQTSLDNMTREQEIAFMNKYYSNGVGLSHAIIHGDIQSVLYQVYRFVQEAELMRPYMPFKYDGIVVSYLDPVIRTALGRKNFVNQYSIAIKFNTIKKLTRFTGYTYTVGKDGTITPMIHYMPVEFFGGINTKSSGHSWERFYELNLRKGDILEAEFRNDVMVYIEKAHVEENAYNPNPPEKFPEYCPECGSKLLFSDKSAKCINMICPGRNVARVTDMLAKLGFKGFAEESVRKLRLTGFADLVSVTEERANKALGDVNGAKFIEALYKFLNEKQFDYMILGSLGFSGLASAKWKGILKKITVSELVSENDLSLSVKMQTKPGNIGPKTIETVLAERKIYMDDIMAVYKFPNLITGGSLNDNSACKVIRFTGCRDVDLMMTLNAAGHDCSEGAVTKNTDILLVPYRGYSSTKVATAIKNINKGSKIRVIPIMDFRSNPSAYLM